jgi:hypothetical protein
MWALWPSMLCSNRVSVFVCAAVDTILSSWFVQKSAISRLHASHEWQSHERQKGAGFMYNVEFEVQGDQLIIRIDLNQELGVSSSGKSVIIATTGGNVEVPGWEAIKVGLNVYRPQRVERTSRRLASRW